MGQGSLECTSVPFCCTTTEEDALNLRLEGLMRCTKNSEDASFSPHLPKFLTYPFCSNISTEGMGIACHWTSATGLHTLTRPHAPFVSKSTIYIPSTVSDEYTWFQTFRKVQNYTCQSLSVRKYPRTIQLLPR